MTRKIGIGFTVHSKIHTVNRKGTNRVSEVGVRVIAHRGFAGVYPENTVHAVRSAAPDTDMVEIDVQRCASGELVVFHDDTLDRLTTGSGPVNEHHFDELSSLTVDESTEVIPTLDDLIEIVPPSVGLNVELKHDGMAEEIRAIVNATPNDILVSSFDQAALAELDDGIPTALLFNESFNHNLDVAIELGCRCVHPNYRLCTPNRVEAAHDHDLSVNTWTVPHDEMDTYLEHGVDGIFLNRPLNSCSV